MIVETIDHPFDDSPGLGRLGHVSVLGSGWVTNSIPFCRLFTITDRFQKCVSFADAHLMVVPVVFDRVRGPPLIAGHA